MANPRSLLKKAYGRQGAFWATHSRAVRSFGEAPETPVRKLFRNAASGTKLSKGQRRQVLETLARLKGNQALIEMVSAKISAKELLSNFMKGKTNRELSELLRLPINCITPRVKELREKGHVIEAGSKFDNVTQRNVTVFKAV